MTASPGQPGAASGAVSIYPILAVNFAGTLGFSIVLPFPVGLLALTIARPPGARS